MVPHRKPLAVTLLLLCGLFGGMAGASPGSDQAKPKPPGSTASKFNPARANRKKDAPSEVPAPDPGATADTPAAASDPAAEPTGEAKVVGRVIYGVAAKAGSRAVVDVKKVFEHISSYQKIRDENLKKTKARYHFLLAEANQEFQQAVEIVALAESVDVVVETGGIENADATVVDLTDKVIARIQGR